MFTSGDFKAPLFLSASLLLFQTLVAEGFRVRDLFHHQGLHAIPERQAEARVSPAQASAR